MEKVTVKIRMLHEPVEVDADEAEVLRAQGLIEEDDPPVTPAPDRKDAGQEAEE